MEIGKKKLVVFHQAIAPYRIDFWNSVNDLFDLKLYLMFNELPDQKFDQDILKQRMHFKFNHHKSGFRIGTRNFRWGLISKIRKTKPDVVFGYEYSQITLSLYFIKKIFGFKYKLYTICDDSLHIARACGGLRKIMRNYLAPRLDGLILINSDVAAWYDKNFRLKNKCVVFPIIAEETSFRKGLIAAVDQSNLFIQQYNLAGKKCLYFVGRLVDVKGIDRLITAFSKVSASHADAVLVIIGGGSDLEKLKGLCSVLNVTEKVIFPGRYEGVMLAAWYNIGQVFVLASHYEPFGAVVNEALLSGSTVLCSKNAGASTLVVPGDNGEIFDPYDMEGLATLLHNELNTLSPQYNIKDIRPSKMKLYFKDFVRVLEKEFYKNSHA